MGENNHRRQLAAPGIALALGVQPLGFQHG